MNAPLFARELQTPAAVTMLRKTATIRERANALLARARAGESDCFVIGDDAALHRTAQIVADVTRERCGNGPIPYHSRWRHFEAGGVDRRAELDHALDYARLRQPESTGSAGPLSLGERVGVRESALAIATNRTPSPPPAPQARGSQTGGSSSLQHEQARAHIDLAVVSVLLDAGAGPDWRYSEASSGQEFTRSEGLGVASFRAFAGGLFSSDSARPFQADAAGLCAVSAQSLGAAFQVSPSNPLVGLGGRATLLHRLGDALAAQPHIFGATARPGGLFDALTTTSTGVTAHDILALLLDTLSDVWPAPNQLDGVALGDCWRHSSVRGMGATDGWMPFHKLSQWLTYSLLEPFEWAGITVTGLAALTGLPEYRNGGLLLDAGVIVPKDASLLDRTWQVGDEFIVEWRALTVALLDELAPRVRNILRKTDAEMPLACVLEGGTWAAGRVLAQQLRGGAPPLKIALDGTVF